MKVKDLEKVLDKVLESGGTYIKIVWNRDETIKGSIFRQRKIIEK